MDFGELRMDSTDLLDLLGDHASPDNNMPYDHNCLEAYLEHLNDPTTVKEEPEDSCGGFESMLPSSPLVEGTSPSGRSEDDYGLDLPMENALSSPTQDCAVDEPAGAASALLVVTTGAPQKKAVTTRIKQEQQKKAKRSRRVRTPKQQELNRLAQQRYRERKKQKYTSLQQAVDALSVQLDRVAVVEEERDNLQAENEELQQLLKAQTHKVQARDVVVRQQQKQLELQTTEISALQQRLTALSAADSSPDLRMLQQLAVAIKTALEENEFTSAQMVLHQYPDILLDSISKTVRQCCREMAQEPVVTKPMTQVVQVSCC